MSSCSRNPARFEMNQVSCNKSLIRSIAVFDRTLVICHRPSDPVTISDKVLVLVFSLPQPLTIPKPPVRPVLQQKPDPRIFFFEKTPVIYGRPSRPVTICDKLLVLAFSSSAAPTPSPNRSVRALQQKTPVRNFDIVSFSFDCSRQFPRSNPYYLLSSRPTRGRYPAGP